MWDDAINDLEERRKKSRLGGGQARLDKQHEQGKLTARERIEILIDKDTFVELDDLVESRIDDFGLDKKRVMEKLTDEWFLLLQKILRLLEEH